MPLPSGNPPATTADVASYVATVTAELATLARQSRLETLGYLLEIARLEAESAAAPRRQARQVQQAKRS